MRSSPSPTLSPSPAVSAAAASYDDADFATDLHAAKLLLAEAAFQDSATKSAAPSASTFSHRPASSRTTHVFTSFSTPVFRSVFDNRPLEAEAREQQRRLRERHERLTQLYLSSSLTQAEKEPPDSEAMQGHSARCREDAADTAARRSDRSSRPETAHPRVQGSQKSKLAAARAELQETRQQLQQSLAAEAGNSDDEGAAAAGGSCSSSAWMSKRGYCPSTRITRAELLRYQQIFRTLDSDHSGSLSASELQSAFRSLHLPLSREELLRVMEGIDDNGDERITLTEFVQAMARGAARGADGDWDCVEGIQRDRREQRQRDELKRREAGPCGLRRPSKQRSDGQVSESQGCVLLPFSLWVPAWSRKQRFEQLMHSKQRARQRQEARMARQPRSPRSKHAAASAEGHHSAVPHMFSDHSYVALQPVSFVSDSASSDTAARSIPSLEVEGAEEEAERESRPVPVSPLLGRRLVRRGSVEVEWVRKEEEQDDAGSLVWKWKRTRQQVAAAAERQQQQRQQRSRSAQELQRSGCTAKEAPAAEDAALDDISCWELPAAVKACGCTRRSGMLQETSTQRGRKGKTSGAAGKAEAAERQAQAEGLQREVRKREILQHVSDSVAQTQTQPTAERAASVRTKIGTKGGEEAGVGAASGRGIDKRREQELLSEVEALLQQELLDALLLDSEAAIASNRETVAQLTQHHEQQEQQQQQQQQHHAGVDSSMA